MSNDTGVSGILFLVACILIVACLWAWNNTVLPEPTVTEWVYVERTVLMYDETEGKFLPTTKVFKEAK